jgi:ATP-dependent exoDNAse (exonuclease V) alpha subunit
MVSVVPYRLSTKIVGKTKGNNIVSTSAYINRETLKDQSLGKTFDYRKGRSPVLYSNILAPSDAPTWAQDRGSLWNEVINIEKRKKAQFARMVEISLPHQLSQEQMRDLVDDFVKENFISQGMIADVAIHAPSQDGDERNFHAHILLTLRPLNEKGAFANKERDWNQKSQLKKWRQDLALKCSNSLELAGYYEESIRWKHSHLSLKEQLQIAIKRRDYEYADACDHQPTKHKGRVISALEKKGLYSYVAQEWQEQKEKQREVNVELNTPSQEAWYFDVNQQRQWIEKQKQIWKQQEKDVLDEPLNLEDDKPLKPWRVFKLDKEDKSLDFDFNMQLDW